MKTLTLEKNQILYILLALAMCFLLLLALAPAGISVSVAAFLILGMLAFKNTEIFLFFLTIYIPLEPFLLKFTSDEIYPYLRLLSEGLVLILFLTAILKHINTNGFKYIRTPIDLPLAVFIVITAISALVNFENPSFWVIGLRQIFRYALLYYAIIYSGISRAAAKKLVTVLAALLALETIIGLSQAIIGSTADALLLPGERREFGNLVTPDYVRQFLFSGERIFATMGRYDRLGTFLSFGLILIAGLAYELKNERLKRILKTIFLYSLSALVLTYSRMSWLGLALGIGIIGILIKKDKKLIFGLTLASVAVAGYLGLYLFLNGGNVNNISNKADMPLAERALALFSARELRDSYYGYGRLYFIANTPKKIVKNNPLFGVGLGQYGGGVAAALGNNIEYRKAGLPFGIGGEAGQIDNNWFSIWGESGTLGVLAFGWIIVSLFIFSYRTYKSENNDSFKRGLSLAMLGIIPVISFQSFLGPYFEVRPLSYNFWLLAGLMAGLALNERNRNIEELTVNRLTMADKFAHDKQ
ncbi:MAG: O-antigen ligase family protein [Patescibacteria group bacterium]|jgi:hypothetical protein